MSVVSVDTTAAAGFALRHIVPYAVDQRSQLTLLSVVPDPPAMIVAAGTTPERLAEAMDKDAETHLREITASLPQDLSVTTVLRHGDPAEQILAYTREQPFDLLVLGARGRGRVTGALLGSVSTAVLHHSAIPVVVMHPAPGDDADPIAD